MSTQQILKGTSVTVTETFQVDGAPTDLDSGVPTVVAKFPDGTALTPAPVASGAWAGRTTGQYRIVLDAQPEVTYLDPISWTGTIGGKPQVLYSRVEWVGTLLFGLSALRGLNVANGYPFATNAVPNFTDQQIQDARTATLDEFQRILGFSPVPRFQREIHDGNGGGILQLDQLEAHHPPLSVTVNGVAQSVGSYTLRPSGILQATSNYTASGRFTPGSQNVTVEYVAGWRRVEGEAAGMAVIWAAMRLNPTISSQASSMTTPDGATYDFDPAGQITRAGTVRHSGVPKLDAWLHRHSQAGLVVG